MISIPTIDVAILLAVGLLEVVFTVYIFRRYYQTASIRYFGLFTLCVAGWVLTNGIGLLLPRGSIGEEIIYRFSFLFAAFMFPLLYLYILSFPYPSERISPRFIFFLFLPPGLLTLFILASKSLVVDFEHTSLAWTIFGPDYWIYSAFTISMFIIVLVETFRKIRGLDDPHRYTMRMIFLSVLVAGVIGFTNHLILPYFFKIQTLGWLGPGASLIWLGMMGRIVYK